MPMLIPIVAVRHWMKDAKRSFIDPELERNTGPNLAEHPLWPELKKAKEKKRAEQIRDDRIAKGPSRMEPK
jgi:hypothetical protein